MDTPNPHPSGAARLKTLLKAAGLTSFRMDATWRGVLYSGSTRDWLLFVRLAEEWLHVYTVICEVPKEPGLRARLLEHCMRANSKLVLAKFGISERLVMEVDYRAQHVDASVLGNLVSYLHVVVEDHYPKVFRIVSGDETLQALAAQLPAAELPT